MAAIRFAVFIALLLLATPAPAAEVVYPPGSRIGLIPAAGLVASTSFFGFEDPDNKVGVILGALPPEAFAEIEKTADAATMKKQGLTLENREELSLAIGKAFLIRGREAEGAGNRRWLLVAATPELTVLATVQVPEAARATYTDETIRALLSSIAIRSAIPVEEQLSLLPFKIGELASFQIGAVLPGRAVILSDSPKGTPISAIEPHLVITVAQGGPAQTSERDAFARDLFGTIANLKDIRINVSEPLRIGGQIGHQLLATAKDAATGAEVTVVQWLRFGGSGYLQIIGVATTERWTPAYGRFREVRDSIEPR